MVAVRDRLGFRFYPDGEVRVPAPVALGIVARTRRLEATVDDLRQRLTAEEKLLDLALRELAEKTSAKARKDPRYFVRQWILRNRGRAIQ